jgi:hypothetical protein
MAPTQPKPPGTPDGWRAPQYDPNFPPADAFIGFDPNAAKPNDVLNTPGVPYGAGGIPKNQQRLAARNYAAEAAAVGVKITQAPGRKQGGK